MGSDSTGNIQKYVLKERAKNNILDLFIGWKRDKDIELNDDAKELVLKLADDLVGNYSVVRQVEAKKLEISDGESSITEEFVTLNDYESMFNEFMDITTRLIIDVIGIELERYLNKNKE